MYDAEVTAVATGAAGTLVAAIATWGAGKMQVAVGHFFRRGTPQEQRAAMEAVNATAAELSSGGDGARAAAAAAWTEVLAQYLSDHRDLLGEVDGLGRPGSAVSSVWNQHNTGTGTFVGGNVYGGLTIQQGGGPDDGR
ncbi:hypothetical protein ACGF07_22690 [Kitasatospora sp. NPDC048194]|uniref:hypothetical protein n=1 Tax=Kitasatospora sp. NPDC048194 TaxID=3364045 RepID=UPI003710A6CA